MRSDVSITLGSRNATEMHVLGSDIVAADRATEWVTSNPDHVIVVTITASTEELRRLTARGVQRVLYFPDEL